MTDDKKAYCAKCSQEIENVERERLTRIAKKMAAGEYVTLCGDETPSECLVVVEHNLKLVNAAIAQDEKKGLTDGHSG